MRVWRGANKEKEVEEMVEGVVEKDYQGGEERYREGGGGGGGRGGGGGGVGGGGC